MVKTIPTVDKITKGQSSWSANSLLEPKGPSEQNGSKNEDVRRMKKRELDRKCQRMARDHNKAHIAELEKLVESFQQQDDTGRMSSLMEELALVKRERDDMAKTLGNIAKLTQGMGHGVTVKSEERNDNMATKQSVSTPSSHTSTDPEEVMSQGSAAALDRSLSDIGRPYQPPDSHLLPLSSQYIQSILPGQVIMDNNDPNTVLGSWPVINETFDPSLRITAMPTWQPLSSFEVGRTYQRVSAPAIDATISLIKQSPATDLWKLANDVLTYSVGTDVAGRVQQAAEALDEHIPIRAITEGWDSVEHFTKDMPGWQALRRIDENIFYKCGQVERLAVLVTMNSLLRAHTEHGVNKLGQLPNWYMTQPTAAPNVEHPYAISFFPWPGLRYRFVHQLERYYSNTFWELFAGGYQFRWPFELRDCYQVNKFTKKLHISSSFMGRIRDLRSWTLGPDFFEFYPELYRDVPAHNSIPGMIHDLDDEETKPAHSRALQISQAPSPDFQIPAFEPLYRSHHSPNNSSIGDGSIDMDIAGLMTSTHTGGVSGPGIGPSPAADFYTF